MVKRSARVPLYEYMRGPTPRGAPGTSPESGPERAAASSGSYAGGRGSLVPGHVVRLPTGLVLTAVAVVIVLLIGVYVLGSWRGKAAAEAVYREQLLRYGLATEVDRGERARDPLRAEAGMSEAFDAGSASPPEERRFPGAGGGTRETSGTAGGAGGAGSAPVAGPRDGRSSTEREVDPIVPGYHYLVIMETNADGAERLVAFCREHGLDAHAVRRHNALNFFVVMLPGFESASDPGLRHLRDVEVPRIGRIWRTLDPGRADFSDAYPVVIRR